VKKKVKQKINKKADVEVDVESNKTTEIKEEKRKPQLIVIDTSKVKVNENNEYDDEI